MCDLDLAAIRTRADAATEGPWTFDDCSDVRGAKGEFRAPGPWNGFMLVGPWLLDADPKFIAAARSDIPALLAEVERLRAERLKVLTSAREWRDQSTDYDEDTEQQIQDGLEITRVLGDPCPHARRETTTWNPNAAKTWVGLLDNIPLPPDQHRCWVCGQTGNLDPEPADATGTASAAPVAANRAAQVAADPAQASDAPQVPLLDEWGRRHEDDARPIGPPFAMPNATVTIEPDVSGFEAQS